MPEKFQGNNRNLVSILEGCVISIPRVVVVKAKLKPCQLYQVDIVRSRPFLLLFKEDMAGTYTLSPQGKHGGAKFTLRKLYRLYLHGRIRLPLQNLRPIIWDDWGYDFGLMLEDNFWTSIPFTTAGLKELSEHEYGVYYCVDAKGHTLRIGEGWLKQRMQEHLRNQWLDIVEFRHFLITDENSEDKKADGQFYENIFLRRYEEAFGELPKYNKILR